MSAQNNQDQEIDLSLLTKKIAGIFDSINKSIFKSILFVKKNIVIFGVLFILGGVLGYILDKSSNVYDSEITVTPNFGSVDYLYSKINLLESKIKDKDTVFFKSIGINNSKDIKLIEIEPIIDIYSFVRSSTESASNAQNSQNFELVKLLSEDGDIKKVVKDELTSKNYTNHKIKITSDSYASSVNSINPILSYFDKNEIYEKYRKSYLVNFNNKIKQNDIMVSQIDALINQFSETTSSNQKSDKLVYYNENTQLNDILETKDRLINENNLLRNQLISIDKVIKEISRTVGVKNKTGANNKMKFILPFLFVSLFIIFGLFMSFYKKQSAKISNN